MPTPRDAPGPNYAAGRNAIPGYAFPGQRVEVHFVTALPVRTCSHRSLGAYTKGLGARMMFKDVLFLAACIPVLLGISYLGLRKQEK